MSTNFLSWHIFAFLAAIGAIFNGVFGYMIASYLSKHGNKISFWWDMRFHLLKYLKQYRKLTIEQNGRPGALFYAWVAAIGLFLVSVIFLIILIASRQ
jgi:membrane protein YqaA with SNARE-associated domain